MTMLRTGLTGIALVALLAACGDGEKADTAADQVVTLNTATPGATAAASPATRERPLLRPDASQEEEDRLYDVYFACLADNGSPKHEPQPGGPADGPVAAPAEPDADFEAKEQAAAKACEHLEPEEPWQLSQRTDPHYADKLRDWITCIRSHGIDAWEEDGFVAFESLPPENQLALVDECQIKAFDVA
ncbi:hypothetical protein J2S43_007965 [Catenuloplanes nepalensis]|uniref:Lipoprotein n=1 Tax=Catenuloplanes nepalensis TaxID=587533 RepID=A0ABT9N6Y0_9ACTN|nr:hypothetical protein [Catenuloplanes nepalensis]MDP9799453.1 hypothetical protein [Catenuloplanes nepalensis]